MTEAEATAYLPTKDGEGKAASGDGLDTRHGNGVSVDPFYAHARTAYRIYVPIKRCRKEGWAAGDMVRLVAGEKVAATHNMLVQNTACAQDQAEIPSCPAPTSLTSSPTIIARIWPTRHCPDEHGCILRAGMMQQLHIMVGDVVKIQPIAPENPQLATSITLTYDHGNELMSKQDLSMLNSMAKESLVAIGAVQSGMLIRHSLHGQARNLTITKIKPESSTVYSVTTRTSIRLSSAKDTDMAPPLSNGDGFEAVGGLSDQIDYLKRCLSFDPVISSTSSIRPPTGILLYGPSGTGKTMLAKAVATSLGNHAFIPASGSELIGRYMGETEANLRALFRRAQESAPAILFLDEIDALCPKRDESESQAEKRIVAMLLTLLDGYHERSASKDRRVIVLAATNRPNALDPALRRPGRFDTEVEIGIPTAADRLDILLRLFYAHACNTEKEAVGGLSRRDIEEVAAMCHGYVGADLAALVRESAILAIRRSCRTVTSTTDQGPSQADPMIVRADVMEAVKLIKPSAMREVTIEVPKVLWSDIGGQEATKAKLRETVQWPLMHGEAYKRLGISPPKGVLLYGPPGCSKTLLAKALATEAGLNFLAVKGPELLSKWVGESEKAVREIFRKARAASPSIIFFDEIDAIAQRRTSDNSVLSRVLSQMLHEMDGIQPLHNVTILAATNRPDVLDTALMRPGRMDYAIYVSPPDDQARREIFRIQFSRMAVIPDPPLETLTQMTEGCSGAEIVSICQEAAYLAIEEDSEAEQITDNHLLASAKGIHRNITPAMLKFYEDFDRKKAFQ